MKILLPGGGARALALGRALQDSGAQVDICNPDGPVPPDWATRMAACDVLIFPIPTTVYLWGPEGPDCTQALHAVGQARVIGAWPHQGPSGCINLLERDDFKAANAIPTAEGAISCALQYSSRTFADSRVLLVGWGAVAQALAARLLPMGAHLRVWTRRPVALPDDVEAVGIDWQGQWQDTDFIFNTVPAPVIPSRLLHALPTHCLLCELASAPFGFNPSEAQSLGLRTLALPGLPRMFSHSTARLTADCILKILNCPEKI